MVEGTKNTVTDIIPNKMEEVLRYETLGGEHAYLWGFMAVSQDFLDSLPPDLKALTVAGICQMANVQLEFNKGAEGRQGKVFVEGGGEFYVPTEEEMETFRAVKNPMRDWYVEQFGQEWYERFVGASTECEAWVDAKLAGWGSR